MLYLVQGEVVRNEYTASEGRHDKPSQLVIRLVEAEFEDEAVRKFKDHWEVNSSFGGVYFYVNVHDCSEVIR